MSDKPRVLVLGGLGFIGRNVVRYLADNNIASKICVADKVLVDVAGLSSLELKIFKSDLVTCKQVNLSRENTIAKVFEHDGGNWDFVINLAAATKYSQPDDLYRENIVEVARTTANAALKYKAKRYVHVSTGQVYDAGKKPSSEDDKIKPWTALAKASLEGEEAVKGVKGLNFVIVRPSIVYGPGDVNGITPRIIMGIVYKKLGEKMECLWDKDLKLNTVHVRDASRALWHLTSNGNNGETYNLCDEGDSDQGTVTKFIGELFGIKTGFQGNTMSKIATSVSMKSVAEFANDKHLKPWSDVCKEYKIIDSQLTPYLDEELLYNNSLSVDGTKITKTGFKYELPKVTAELLREVIVDFEEKGAFPKGLLV